MARFWVGIFSLWSIPATTALSSSYTFSDSLISQQVLDGENFLNHDGVRGPYVDRISYGISRDPPAQCSVDQVIMVKRHGERYPASDEGTSIEQALKKVNDSIAGNYSGGDLAFLSNWTYFVPSDCYEAETSTGPYAGLTSAYNHGRAYRQRYGNLYNESTILPLFTADFQRIISTAQNFGQGFLGNDSYATKAALNIISESDSQGADSLTPTCHVQDDDAQSICDDMPYYLPQFDVAADRLNAQYQGLNLNWTDVYSLIREYPFSSIPIKTMHTLTMGSNDRLRAQHALLITLDRRLHHRRMDQFRTCLERQLLLLRRVNPQIPSKLQPYHTTTI